MVSEITRVALFGGRRPSAPCPPSTIILNKEPPLPGSDSPSYDTQRFFFRTITPTALKPPFDLIFTSGSDGCYFISGFMFLSRGLARRGEVDKGDR